MPLSGHSTELSLADLVQANVLGRNTCRILVATPEGRGVFYVEDGEVTDASYGDLTGADAFYVLIARDNAFFQVDSGLTSDRRTIFADWQKLVLEAMRLRDEGRLPVPQFPTKTGDTLIGPPPGETNVRPFPAPPSPPSTAGTASASGSAAAGGGTKRSSSSWILFASGALIAVLAVVGGIMLSGSKQAQPPAPALANVLERVEASTLNGRGDVQPVLASGPAPTSPDPTSAVKPTIVCRILIDERGVVKDAKVFRSRLDLATFEDAAIEAVKKYTFKPARHAGQAVPVWINWPVTFQ